MPDITPNLGLKKPLGNEAVSRAAYNENLDILDQNAVRKGTGIAELDAGNLADRPTAGVAGRYYFAQDTGEIYLDTGTEWVLAAASSAVLNAHLTDTMPHKFIDGGRTYKWGMKAVNGIAALIYEEVI